MKKLKNILLTAVFAVMLSITGLFLSSCNPAGVELEITSSIESGQVELFVGESKTIYFTVSNFGSANAGKVSISVYDDAGSSTDKNPIISEHISMSTPAYNNNGITMIEITGVSGGQTTLIATTSGGSSKSVEIDINIREYATSAKDIGGPQYILPNSTFIPDINNYYLGATTTEKELSFYVERIAFENDNSGNKLEFNSVELIEKNGKYFLEFTGLDNRKYITSDYYEDRESISFFAKYNNPNEELQPVQSSLTVLYGFSEKDISILSHGERLEEIQLIAYKQFGNNVEFSVSIPDNSGLIFDYEIADPSLISAHDDQNGNEQTISVSNKVSKEAQTSLTLNVYYPNFKGKDSNNENCLVSYSKTIPVKIAVMPSEIRVNGQSGETKTYNLYNNNVDDYGWQELKVGVYREDSTFSGYTVDFEEREIQVRQGLNHYLVKGEEITDLATPIYIRGINTASEGEGNLTLSVKSDIFDETDDVSIKVKYQIRIGANSLMLSNEEYEYSSFNEDRGIYISTNSEEKTFTGLSADKKFEKAIFKQVGSGEPAVELTLNEDMLNEQSVYGYIVPIKVKPLREGTTTFTVILDNGRSKDITFKVIDEFTELDVLQFTGNGASNDGFFDLSSENNAWELIVKSKASASIRLSAPADNKVISHYDYFLGGDNCIEITKLFTEGAYTVFASENGEAKINFTVTGRAINADWTINNKVEKTAEITVVCYSLVKDFLVNSNKEDENSFVAYRNEDASLDEKSVEIKISVDSNAYGFRVYDDDSNYSYKADYFQDEYVYWLSDSSLYDANGNLCNKMIFGQVYKIGGVANDYYIGTFDTKNMTFIANSNYTGSMSNVRLYATISQYGSTRYFPIDIKIEEITSVKNISFESKWMGMNSASFSSNKPSETFIVYLNPKNPTVEGVFVRYIKTGEGEPLFVGDLNEYVKELGNGTYFIDLKINEAALNAKSVAGGTLEFIPKAWMNGSSINSNYASKILRLNVRYENGSKINPYSITTAEELIAIGKSYDSMSDHYIIDRPISLSGKELPIGGNKVFSGSIRGISTTAAITGVTVSQGAEGNYGLFSKITGEIRNLRIAGNINASVSENCNIGLIAGVNEGRLVNVAVELSQSNVAVVQGVTAYIGGLVGQNSGLIKQSLEGVRAYYNESNGEDEGEALTSISSLITAFMKGELLISSSNSSAVIYAGGLAGLTNSNIVKTKDEGVSYYNYSEYTAYTRIRANGSGGTAYLGGIAGKIEGNSDDYSISGLLVGGNIVGEVSGNYVGGVAGEFGNHTRISSLTTRTFVQGTNVGAVVGKVTAQDFGTIHIPSSITIQAIDEGENLLLGDVEIPKPMIIRNSGDMPAGEENYNGKLAYVVAAGSYGAAYTWIAQTESFVKTENDSLYDDFIILFNKEKKEGYSFGDSQAEATLISVNEGFHEMKAEGEETTQSRMFYMYYFEAESYLQGETWTRENLAKAQNILDEKLNRVKIGSELCPFKLSANTSIFAKNNVITVAGDELIINKTGLAELSITNLLNQRVEQEIFVYVINYFDVNAYGNTISKLATPFKVGGETITSNGNSITLYENSLTHINIEPVYAKRVGEYEIDTRGEVEIENMTIRLVQKSAILAEIEKNDDGTAYFVYEIGSDLIVLSRSGDPTSTDENTITITAKLSQTHRGKTFSHLLGQAEVVISYKQGATAIIPGMNNYVMDAGIVRSDIVYFETDDEGDSLSVQILDGNEETKLFKVEVERKTGKGNYSVSISVDKGSQEYRARFTQDIYREYTVRYSGKNGFEKRVKLSLEKIALRPIVIDNYESINDQSLTSEGVVPGQNGVLSISITPEDADFSLFRIKNSDMNYFEGASIASMQVGYMNDQKVFTAISSGVRYFSGGLEISRQSLIDTKNYDGQIYIQYSFGKYSSVIDGASVGFDVELLGLNQERLDGSSVTYTINNKVLFDISIANKDYLADGKYYLARGLSYELIIENNAFDADSITITTDNPQIAWVEEDEDVFILHIESDITNREFNILYSADRTTAFGESEPIKGEKVCEILEYVINYRYDSTTNPTDDIIRGMSKGQIAVALGNKLEFELDFGTKNYLEYDAKNQDITASVKAFLKSAKENGVWNVYTDLAINTEDSEVNPSVALPIKSSTSKAAVSTFGKTAKVATPYFEIDGYSFTPRRIHEPKLAQHYSITFETAFEIDGGRYKVVTPSSSAIDKNRIKTEFSIEAYLRGSDESPNPVYDYAGLKALSKVGAHYILMNDIEISPDEFEMLQMNAKTFDGNGYKIILTGKGLDEEGNVVSKPYVVGNNSNFALFNSISIDSIVKNLTVQVGQTDETSEVRFDSDQTAGLQFAIFAASNLGSISNCKVVGSTADTVVYLNHATTPRTSGFNMAGLVATNSGKITNSRVELCLRSSCSMAGFVASNSGNIASSYFKGNIKNESEQRDVFYTAGFAISNSESANIITSFTSGVVDSTKVYSSTVEKRLDSGVSVAGFIATNLGNIRDCYSNIPIQTDAISSGFVFANGKSIENCFSTSIILGDNSQTNAYFVKNNIVEGQTGSYKNCFYLSDSEAEYTGLLGETKKGINTTLQPLVVSSGLEELSAGEFDSLAEKFGDYAYTTTGDQVYSSVWFLPDNIGKDYFNGQTFARGRLELTSANMIAFAQRKLVSESLDANGFTTYTYQTSERAAANGSALNPYLVSSATQLEEYIGSSRGNYQSNAFVRLIKDIDYSKDAPMTQLYKTSFNGVLEGNGMKISGVEIYSDETMESAGFFGKLKGSTSQTAGILNLSLIPSVVSFSNTKIVGGIAGVAERANIFNVNVLNNSGEEQGDSTSAGKTIIVSGKNIVGGVVGRATQVYNIKNITSLVGSKATHISTSTADVGFMDSAISQYSYSGVVVGYADGREGQISNTTVRGSGAIAIGAKAGFIAGGLARNVSLSGVHIDISSDAIIRAYVYGGIVVGESRANLSNVQVKGSGTSFELFKIDPYTPAAVGGIVGRAVGGSITNVYMGQSFEVSARSQLTGGLQTIASVGGIAGRIDASPIKIEEAIVEANISARRVLGGIVGIVSSTKVEMSKVAIYRGLFTLTGLTPMPYVGGFVGDVASNAIIEITDAYSLADIAVACYVYSNTITANVGAIIGNSNGSISLKNIYTTTKYDVALQDNTSSGVLTPVYAEDKGNKENTGNISFKWQLNFNKDDIQLVNYNLNAFNANNVYFYAYWFSLDTNSNTSYYDAILNGGAIKSESNKTTRFSVKIDNKNMNLVQNEYGQGIYNYQRAQQQDHINEWTTKNPILSESLFYGMFKGDAYKNWSSSGNALPYLNFEKNLMGRTA